MTFNPTTTFFFLKMKAILDCFVILGRMSMFSYKNSTQLYDHRNKQNEHLEIEINIMVMHVITRTKHHIL
jgi:hypothetical protein